MPENTPTHTPVFDTGCYVGANADGIGVFSLGGALLATVHPHPQQTSRAKLYAAAPDLLEAAKRAVAAFAALGSPECEAAKRCRAAINRATGD